MGNFKANEYFEGLEKANRLRNKMDALLVMEFAMYRILDNTKCEKCGEIQGIPKKGFKKYYCECIGKKVDRKFAKEKKIVTQELFATKFWEKKNFLK